MDASLIVYVSRHNTALASRGVAFSDAWYGASSCFIVLLPDRSGGGNVISD